MKKPLIILWLLVPVVVIAWHYGPGQAQLQRDHAGGQLRAARAAANAEDWAQAADLYGAAAKALPEEDVTGRQRLLLAQATYRVRAGELIEGQEQLEQLLSGLEAQDDRDPDLTASVRHELATASYFAAWLMRLEGATVEEWKPEAERARQQYRLLAEQAVDADDEEDARDDNSRADAFKKNLESTIRLEQMDLSVLKSMPPPKNCPCNCKNLSQRKRKQCQSRCKGKGKGQKKEKKEDVRQALKKQKGAGLNQRAGGGS